MKALFIVMFLFFTQHIYAQHISGTIFNEEGKPLTKASVSLLLAKDSSVQNSTTTDELGKFRFTEIKPGSYLVIATAVGYNAGYTSSFDFNGTDQNLPTLILGKTSTVLSNVVITSKRPPVEVKAGKTVINVDASPTNTGLNVLEVLEKSPGVSVDNDGNVSLKGKAGVLILIDGKQTYLSGQSLAAFLKSIQANSLDQIEIMINPPAKYDAAGGAGIINIKTKKGTIKGINGNMNFNYAQGFYPKYNGGANFNYRNNKINVFGGYNGGVWEGLGILTINRNFYRDEAISGSSDQTTNRHNKSSWHNMKLGADYYFTSKDVIGVVINGNINPWKNWQKSISAIKDVDQVVNSSFVSDAYNANKSSNITTNINYKHTFDSTGREISTDLDYGYYESNGKNLLSTEIYNPDNSKRGNTILLDGSFPSVIKIYTGKIDYVHPFNKNEKLEVGIKSSYVDIDNDVIYRRDTSTGWFPDETRSNHFLYKENVNAAYAIFSKNIKKWDLSAGLRIENTNAKGIQVKSDSSFTRSYTNLFPNAAVMYNANDKNQVGLSYSRRIRRPDYDALNPFIFFLDSLTYGQGNPYLQPEFSNNIELSYTFNRFLTTTINYTQTDDIITDILKQNTEKRTTFQTKENFSTMKQWGLTITANKQMVKWWNLNIYLNLFDNRYKGLYNDGNENHPVQVKATGLMSNMTNSFTFAKTWTAELSGWYTNRISEGLMIGGNMGALNMALAKQILKKNGTIKIGIRDIFRTQNFNGYSRYADVDLSVHNDRRKDNRQFLVSFTYKFGKNNIAPARRRGGASEEQNRIKSGGN
ncbi:MAG: TonB-dependent receptor [Agriterribacter sp.]